MQKTNAFKQSFLKTMLLGLKLGVSSKKMSYQERKRTIKLSANIAMAVAGDGRHWSLAIIAHHAKQEKNKTLMWRMLGRRRCEKARTENSPRISSRLRRRSQAEIIAKSPVKKRTEILKRLVPGGEAMDDLSLLGEAIDYVISLQAQVDLMKLIIQTFSKPSSNSHSVLST
ncbi:hypothetical protein AXF42_Ash005791 [Apostasia shenzhenica]|uniref:BHLH domain-containing protein n=1 Tax=Apostasia shenzhenica TaxID=1088818 RepID=A0A2I0BCD6_9ASPA|nr:hypothetical protein AXF42_Ash005791 [Apostasia shenzhenica]